MSTLIVYFVVFVAFWFAWKIFRSGFVDGYTGKVGFTYDTGPDDVYLLPGSMFDEDGL